MYKNIAKTLFVLLLVLKVSACGNRQNKAVEPTEDLTAKHDLQGIWLDEDGEEINKSHTTALQAAMMAKKANAKELFLVHVPENPDLRKRMLAEAQGVFPDAFIPSSFQNL